ncbi:MAG TPA: hypothetical protein VKC34_09610 [Blastocatellia bacterium]|nr:hypothetical protein [Blastocatellia bacterium]
MMHLRRYLSAMLFLSIAFACSSSVLAQTKGRGEIEQKIATLRAKIEVLEKEFLEPSPEDRAAFAEFLKQPDTGLTRVLPREKYQQKMTIAGGGSYYSFRRVTHEYGYGSDISLEQGQFRIGFAGADYGFIASLGDIPLQSVTLDHPGIHYLAGYKVPSSISEIRDEQRRVSSGFESNGFKYRDSVGADDNTTYVLRSIEVRTGDTMVAFRVVRRDADGSLTLLWKILVKSPAPTVARDKEPGQ